MILALQLESTKSPITQINGNVRAECEWKGLVAIKGKVSRMTHIGLRVLSNKISGFYNLFCTYRKFISKI